MHNIEAGDTYPEHKVCDYESIFLRFWCKTFTFPNVDHLKAI